MLLPQAPAPALPSAMARTLASVLHQPAPRQSHSQHTHSTVPDGGSPSPVPGCSSGHRKHRHRHAGGRVYYTTQAKNPGQDPIRVRNKPALYQKVNTMVNPILLWLLQSKRNIKRKIFIHRGKLKRVCPAHPSCPAPSAYRPLLFPLPGAAEYRIFTGCRVVGVLLLLSSIKATVTESCHSCSSPGRAEGQHQLPSLSALLAQGTAMCTVGEDAHTLPLASARTQHSWHRPCGL